MKIILGVDPGTNVMGYGLIKVEGNELSLIEFSDINFKKHENHYLKLKNIFSELTIIIEKYNPDEIAIESPFFGKNVQSMLKLGRAQGVAMAAGLIKEIPVTEYSPKKIKMAITGNGNASKDQVAKMLKSILKFKKIPKNLDATDGLAVALCHHYNSNTKNKIEKKFSGWSSYLKNNPNKKL